MIFPFASQGGNDPVLNFSLFFIEYLFFKGHFQPFIDMTGLHTVEVIAFRGIQITLEMTDNL